MFEEQKELCLFEQPPSDKKNIYGEFFILFCNMACLDATMLMSRLEKRWVSRFSQNKHLELWVSEHHEYI